MTGRGGLAKLRMFGDTKRKLRKEARSLRSLPKNHARRRSMAQDIVDTRKKYEHERTKVTGVKSKLRVGGSSFPIK